MEWVWHTMIKPERKVYTPETRTITIDGVETSLRLEVAYWRVIEALGRNHGVPWRVIVTRLIANQPEDYTSRSGWVRFLLFTRALKARRSVAATGPGNADE